MAPPTTHAGLLDRLRDPKDADAWSRFVDLYGPVIYQYVRRRGLQDQDAADVTQEVFRAVSSAVARFVYDPQYGSFRGWLFTVTQNELRTFLRKKNRHVSAVGGTTINQLLNEQPFRDEDASAQFEEHFNHRLFSCAVEQVRYDFRESTWQAFWLTAVEGKSGKEVAEHLNITTAAVYLARGRVLARLKQQVAILEQSSLEDFS